MPTSVPIVPTQEPRLWTAEEFLQWLPGFWVRRAWLDPDHLPAVASCLQEILSGA